MKAFHAIAAVACTVIGAACSQITVSTSGPEIPIVRLRTEPYSFSFNSGWDSPTRTVIRDQAAWEEAWARTHQGHTPVAPAPVIDFSKEMVILVATGVKPSGGYSIVIERAAEVAADGIAVTVRSTSPGAQCYVTAALTQPVDIARVARRDGPVHFVERAEERDCS